MSTHTLPLTPELITYLDEHSVHEPELLTALRLETINTFEAAPMQISPALGQFFRFFLETMQAETVLEIGTFTGYSAICMALALPEQGHVTCCDSSHDWTRLAEKYWGKMHLSQKITLHLAPAIKTMEKLLQEKKQATYDFAFIDADKINYLHYYEYCLQLVRPGGVIAIDNVLWNGEVVNPQNQMGNTRVIRELNDKIYSDNRVTSCIIPIGDGLTLVRKK
ncbi:MAG: SAM-dependent methyltransferase [Gammaproteobacteria bacterium CG_4_10_14_0_8_um_filter_38_16]|nr:MAG: SAM-dependent methyltransferase [Gammaproteobacteria bacterium CG_4_10_14_0_8_um_filter_38_16]PJA04430.1 MAG: SAM-dependent methyltransferase [Gammaproteobacteria bacterium CG_4_10_14_0_2_um_filter_38_22]PJB10170.1 MAG: SAM-dependent methyltransferase [Gammaproteobacteria bacterium CG_4_9_14_3_um_filter_38_9]